VPASQQQGHVRVTVRAMSAPRPAAKDDRAGQIVPGSDKREEPPDGFLSIPVNSIKLSHVPPLRKCLGNGIPLRRRQQQQADSW
jgi:hypothetical protein